MADIVWADVLAHAPELSVASAGAQTDVLAYVNQTLSSAEFGGDTSIIFKLARILLAAHMVTMSLMATGTLTGPVIGESEGQVSRQYWSNSPMGTDPLLDKSTYGQQFRTLVRRSPARAPVVL